MLTLFGQFVQAQRRIEFKGSIPFIGSTNPPYVVISRSDILGSDAHWSAYSSISSNNELELSVILDFVANGTALSSASGTISLNGGSPISLIIPANKSNYSLGTSFTYELSSEEILLNFQGFNGFRISKVSYSLSGSAFRDTPSSLPALNFAEPIAIDSPSDLFSFFNSKISLLSTYDGVEIQWFYKELINSDFNGAKLSSSYRIHRDEFESDKNYLFIDSVYFDNKYFLSATNPILYRFPVAKSGSILLYRLRGFVKNKEGKFSKSPWLYSRESTADSFGKYKLYNTCYTNIIESLDGKTIPSMAIDFSDKSGNKYLFSFKDGNGKLLQSGLLPSLNPSNPAISDLIVSTPIYDIFDREIGQVIPFVLKKDAFGFTPNLNKVFSDGSFFSSKSINLSSSGGFCAFPDFKFKSEEVSDGSIRYYSDKNALLGSVDDYPNIKYTPSDAGTDGAGRPFALSTFTSDKTGRKKYDFAPGNAFGEKSKATEYFYTAVFQEELDKYFGSDAGYARFYSKVVTKDPNNLYTLNIKDAKGQVVLSGINGKGPNSPYLDLEGSNGQSTNTVTLINGFGLSELPYTQSLSGRQNQLSVPFVFVNPQTNLRFNYSFEPKPFTYLSCSTGTLISQKCYSCEYEFELKMINDCDKSEAIIPESSRAIISNPTIDINSNNCPPISSNTVLVNLAFDNIEASRDGYTIEKRLTLTEQSIKNAESQFLAKQFNDCGNSVVLEGFRSECESISVPNDPSEIESVAQDAIISAFLSDVSPGGQYGATRTNYRTSQLNKDQKDVQVLIDPYLSVFNEGTSCTLINNDTEIKFGLPLASANFKLPYQPLKGVFKFTIVR